MRYSDLTRRYFESAPHAGVILGEGAVPGNGVAMPGVVTPSVATPGVLRGSAGNRERGTWVQFDIQVVAGRCLDARFLAFGCPHTIAVAAWVAEQALGSWLRAALPEPVAALAQRFEVPAEKLGRLLIVEDAWLAAATSALTLRGGDPMSLV
jgi:NifU-like protein involved in Fe-S cluster formation